MFNYNDAEDFITMDLRHFGISEDERKDVFVYTATGYGMINAGINDGDLLFFKHTDTFKNGDIVCLNVSEQLMVRRIFQESAGVRLRREFGNGEDSYVTNYTLLGKLIGLQRKM